MPNFKYKARDRFGKSTTGIISGSDKETVAKHLDEMGYIPISINQARETDLGLSKIAAFLTRVSARDINIFTRQLLTLQKAGVPLLTSLDTIEKQTKNGKLRSVVREIMADAEHGESLSNALGKHPAIFNEFYVSMVRAGEASGALDEVLGRVLDFGEKDAENSVKIKSAIRYPLITLGALAAAFIVAITFVIPRFAMIFAQFKTALPLPTRMLLTVNFVVRNYWHVTIVIIAILAFIFYKYINTKKGRLRWDGFRLKVPVLGALVEILAMSRFSRTMAILIKSGLPILQVLDMSARTTANAVIARAVDNMISSVREGKGISEPMKLSGFFPPIVVNMVAVGEQTGKVDELLLSVSDYYDQQSDFMIRNLTSMLEPMFVLILGVMVLTMALAIFLPMWNMVTLFKR